MKTIIQFFRNLIRFLFGKNVETRHALSLPTTEPPVQDPKPRKVLIDVKTDSIKELCMIPLNDRSFVAAYQRIKGMVKPSAGTHKFKGKQKRRKTGNGKRAFTW